MQSSSGSSGETTGLIIGGVLLILLVLLLVILFYRRQRRPNFGREPLLVTWITSNGQNQLPGISCGDARDFHTR